MACCRLTSQACSRALATGNQSRHRLSGVIGTAGPSGSDNYPPQPRHQVRRVVAGSTRTLGTMKKESLTYAVPKVPTPTLSISGSEKRFPVRRVYCVGSNFREHAIEMGGNPDKDPPFFFTKPPDAAVDVSAARSTVHYPPETEDLQHEVEMVVAIGKGGRDISTEVATQHVFAYGVGVDLTRRDMQRAAKAAGRPWDCSKGFDSSGPVGALTPVGGSEEEMRDAKRAIWLKVDGEIRQESVLGGMVWSVPEMIARLSQLFTLEPGDILFTGTPSGVAPLRIGDRVEADVEGLEPCRFEIGPLLTSTT